jgi:hypothetical protein
MSKYKGPEIAAELTAEIQAQLGAEDPSEI